jgi:hypothetical protein
MNLIQVVSVSETKTAKNNRPYKVVVFKELDRTIKLNGRDVTVKSNNNNRTRNIWGEGHTEDGVLIKADALFSNIAVNDIVEGSFHTFQTTPYIIGDREVTQYSCVVFSNEDATTYANRNLKQNNATVANTEAISLAPADAERAF